VAPVLADKSLRAEFCGVYPASQINDVRVHRQVLTQDSDRPEEVQQLLQEWRSLYRSFTDLQGDRSHLEGRFQQMETILAKALAEIPVDAVWGQLDAKSWRDQLQTVFNHLRTTTHEILQTYHQQTDLEQRLNRLYDRLQAACRPNLVYTAYLEADVMVGQAAEVAIAFDYMVPNALWRPWHQARLIKTSEEQTSLEFRTDACVWQRTGEDWTTVDLVFSTARASLGTEPPLLYDDLLEAQEKSKQIVVQSRDQRVQTAGLGSVSTAAPGVVELPGVEDGGEVQVLRSPTKATIPSDGQPYRVMLSSFVTPTTLEYVLMPELATQVVVKSEQTNSHSSPILAGPVDLIRSAEFVGRTTLHFIAAQEKFALSWGTEATLRVQRTQEQQKEQNPLTRWYTTTRKVTLFLSNIGAESRTIKTTERIPVSELEQVKVEVVADKTSDRVRPDDNGFCTWHFTLEPYSQQQATLVYKIATAPDVQGI